jgi:hypothetical protein
MLGTELAHCVWLGLSRKADIQTSDKMLGTELAHCVWLGLSRKASG